MCLFRFIPVFLVQFAALDSVLAEEFGLPPREVYNLVEERGESVLFIDVRDPVEIMFTGSVPATDVNIPFLLVDRDRWNPVSGTFLTEQNPRFVAEVEAALAAKGMDRDAAIVTLCRSGSARGEPSAQFLRDEGFPNALFVINGFEGDRLKSGDLAGRRLENGWRNEGLPWSPKMDGDKIYRLEPAQGHAWRVILRSGDTATQAMALILSKMERVQGTPVRILLCGEAGLLAVQSSDYGTAKIQPLNRSPRDLIAELLENGAVVEICAIFLPNRDLYKDDLLPGVEVATPAAVTRDISRSETITLTF